MPGGLLQAQGVVDGTEKAAIASLTGHFTEVRAVTSTVSHPQAVLLRYVRLISPLCTVCSWALRRAPTMKGKPLLQRSCQSGHARAFNIRASATVYLPTRACMFNGSAWIIFTVEPLAV